MKENFGAGKVHRIAVGLLIAVAYAASIGGIGTLIVGGFVVLGVGILMMSLNVFPQSLMAAPAPGESIEQSLAQIPIDLLLGWFFGFAIAAFCEETIFRGFLQEQISRKCSPWVGNLLQALIFSVTHFGMAPLGTLGYEVFQLVFRFGSGLVFGWLKMKRGTLLACGIVHGFIG